MSESFNSPVFGDFISYACAAMDKLVSEDDTSKLEELVVVPAQGVGAGLRGCDYLTFAQH
jgi:hypothetical protein